MKTLVRKGWRDGLALLALAFLSLAMTYPLLFHLSDHVASDLRDPFYSMWVMSWDIRAAGNGFSHFGDANIFFPHQGTLFYADALPVLAALGAPVYLLCGNLVFVYNILFLFSFVLCGGGMYLLVKHLTSSRNAAFVAALVFAFFPYHFAHLSHLELLFLGWTPFCFLFIHRFFEMPSVKNLLGMAVFYVLQVLSCAYYGEYLTLFAGLLILYLMMKKGYGREGRFWVSMGIFIILTAVPLFPYVYSYFKVHQRMLFVRALWEVKFFSAELQHFVAVPPFNIVWGWLTGKLGAHEWQLFPGLVPILLAVFWVLKGRAGRKAAAEPAALARSPKIFILWDILNLLVFVFGLYVGISGGFELQAGIFRLSAHTLSKPAAFLLVSLCLRLIVDPKIRGRFRGFLRTTRPAEKYYLFLIALSGLLSFGPVIRCLGKKIIDSPYTFLYDRIPGFQNLRVPGRFAAMMMIGLAVLSGWGVVAISSRWESSRAKNRVAAAVGALILLEYLSVPIPLVSVPVKDQIPEIYAAVRKLPEGASIIELPMPAHDYEEYEEAPAVYYSIFHRKNIVNGYSGYSPPAYRIVREAMEQFPSDATFGLLEDLGVSYVVVHTGGVRSDQGQEIVGRLTNYASRVERVAEANGDYLFRLIPQKREKAAEEKLSRTGDKTKWNARASLNQTGTDLAFDGDLSTGWSTGYPQRKDDFFELDLGEVVPLKKIVLYLNNNPLDFPRSFQVEGSTDGKTWARLYEKAGFFPALDKSMIEDFTKYIVPIPFEPSTVRTIRIMLTAAHEARHWSINEIAIFN